MTEEEYERKFVELEKYAHGLSEESRVGRFIGGLGDHIRDRVRAFMLKTLIEVIQRTRLYRAEAQQRKGLSGRLNPKRNHQITWRRKYDQRNFNPTP